MIETENGELINPRHIAVAWVTALPGRNEYDVQVALGDVPAFPSPVTISSHKDESKAKAALREIARKVARCES